MNKKCNILYIWSIKLRIKEKKMRKLISVLMVLVMTLVFFPATAIFAETSGDSSGSFSVGSVAPSVSALQVYSDASCNTIASAMTPQVLYYVKVSVSDANTLNAIKEVKLKVYYDPGATHPLETTKTTGHEQTAAIFTWTKIGNAWTVNAGAGSTWVADSAHSVIPTMTASSGDWIFAIKLGKVATETTGDNVWDLHARATDNADYYNGIYCYDKLVNWYGESTILAGDINFGEVELGSGFAANVNKVTGISVKFVTNGDYSSIVKSSSTWQGITNTANLDSSGVCANTNEFSIRGYPSDVFGSSYLLNSTGVNCRDGVQTFEAGESITSGTFWLRIASIFAVDLYNGTITYTIVNR
jgi:hypothetical protein